MTIIKSLLVAIAALAAQLFIAPYLNIGLVRPDFVLIVLVYISARYGRLTGIIVGFSLGLLQDTTGSFSVVGVNAMSKSVVGYLAGTLNGNLSIWTSGNVNAYIYGSLLAHAIIYQAVMALGLEVSPLILFVRIVTEAIISIMIMLSSRYLVPLVPMRL